MLFQSVCMIGDPGQGRHQDRGEIEKASHSHSRVVFVTLKIRGWAGSSAPWRGFVGRQTMLPTPNIGNQNSLPGEKGGARELERGAEAGLRSSARRSAALASGRSAARDSTG